MKSSHQYIGTVDRVVGMTSSGPTARMLASQAEAIVRSGKHGHNIE